MRKRYIFLSILLVLILALVQIYFMIIRGIANIPEQAWFTPEQLCAQYKFPIQRHYVTTHDGYILTMLRIKHGNQNTSSLNPKVVMMQHGLLATPMSFIANTDKRSSAFLLANAGYDVWLGSSRGSTFGRSHTTFDPDTDRRFWDFTWQEMGKYDLFAQIKYIKKVTGVSKLGYVGYSQGTLQMFYALAEFESRLVEDVYGFAAITPVARAGNHKSVMVRYFAFMTKVFDFFGAFEYMRHNDFYNKIASFLCSNWERGCNAYLYYFTEQYPENDDQRQAAVTFANFPGGTSVKNQIHWNQMMRVNKFQLFDYGEMQNELRYDQTHPPQVDLTKISEMPIGLFVGEGDLVTVPQDINWLRQQLNPKVVAFDKTYEGYGHLTFGFGKTAEYVDDVIEFLDKHGD